MSHPVVMEVVGPEKRFLPNLRFLRALKAKKSTLSKDRVRRELAIAYTKSSGFKNDLNRELNELSFWLIIGYFMFLLTINVAALGIGNHFVQLFITLSSISIPFVTVSILRIPYVYGNIHTETWLDRMLKFRFSNELPDSLKNTLHIFKDHLPLHQRNAIIEEFTNTNRADTLVMIEITDEMENGVFKWNGDRAEILCRLWERAEMWSPRFRSLY